jgi:hypothetical protein
MDTHRHGGVVHWMSAFHAFYSEWPYVAVLVFCIDIIVAPCCMNSAISTPFPSQKIVAISSLADNVYLNFFGLFGECVCIQCFDCSVVSTFTNETEISAPVAHTMLLRNSLPSLWYHSKRVKAEGSHSLCSVCTHGYFRNLSCAKLVIA